MRVIQLLLPLMLVLLVAAGCDKPRDPQNPEEMKDKLADKVDLAMWKVDATKEQKKQMDQLLDVISVDFYNFQEENKAIKRAIIAALHKEPVDQAALTELQKKGLDLFDRYTKRLLVAAVDASKILNLEQRRELLDFWKKYEFNE